MQYLRSLSSRCLFAFVAIIVVTTLSAGVPAYMSVRAELDRQAWTQVSDGRRISMAIMETEKIRLENLAILVAQRPTLQDLAQRGDIEALNNYLQTFQTTADLDILVISDESGQVLAKGAGAETFTSARLPFTQEAVFHVLDGERPNLALLVGRLIPVNAAQELKVIVGIILDDTYAKNLTSETGLEHSFLVNEQIASTSLENPPSPVTITDALRRTITSGTTEPASLDFQGAHYYVSLNPLYGETGRIVGVSEVILPVENLLAAKQNALLVLIFSAFLAAAAGSVLASYFVHQLTTPLKDLTNAALKISQGDLNSPVPVPDSPSEIAALASAFEISRKTTLTALNNSSRATAWFETLIQSVVEGIVTIDNQGKVTLFNQGAEQITGWNADDVLGKSINQVFSLMEGDDDFIQQIPQSGGVKHVNVKNCKGGGVDLAVTCAPLQFPQNGTYQTALVIRDISQEEAVRRLSSYFLANISHEFRTPLAALNASVELLLEDLAQLSLAEIAELLNSIHLSVTGLQTLIDNLLESTSIEAGRFHIRCRPTDMNEVVTNALQLMKPLLERRRQNLSLAIPTQMFLVSADPTRLTQVLVNLLSNASKYSPMESTIELCLKKVNEETLRVSVSDQGMGVPLPDRSKLYRPFMRLGESNGTQFGIGLGLSVVKAIIEAHQGEVGMDERPGGGSIFWFTIPLKESL
jgi:two-component system phosphate regulon sensor histidine kinase PhoR